MDWFPKRSPQDKAVDLPNVVDKDAVAQAVADLDVAADRAEAVVAANLRHEAAALRDLTELAQLLVATSVAH